MDGGGELFDAAGVHDDPPLAQERREQNYQLHRLQRSEHLFVDVLQQTNYLTQIGNKIGINQLIKYRQIRHSPQQNLLLAVVIYKLLEISNMNIYSPQISIVLSTT